MRYNRPIDLKLRLVKHMYVLVTETVIQDLKSLAPFLSELLFQLMPQQASIKHLLLCEALIETHELSTIRIKKQYETLSRIKDKTQTLCHHFHDPAPDCIFDLLLRVPLVPSAVATLASFCASSTQGPWPPLGFCPCCSHYQKDSFPQMFTCLAPPYQSVCLN